jgi:hypothetical protein
MDGVMQAKSQWIARRGIRGLLLAVPFTLLAPVASASASLVRALPELGGLSQTSASAPALSASPFAQPATLTLNEVPTPSNITTPSFSGMASTQTTVTVQVYRGGKAEGTEVVKPLTAEPTTEGSWASSHTPPLENGEYTARASQAGDHSSPVTFIVNTSPPNVTLKPVPTLSNNTTPSFSGNTNEAKPVTVDIYAAETPTIVSTATAKVTGGEWVSGPASPPLNSGEYEAIATQESAIQGNESGQSARVKFVVDTTSPTVTLGEVETPSKNTMPAFSGTASDTASDIKTVTVHVYRGSAAGGEPVATAQAQVTGPTWVSGPVSPSLENGEYTAIATQPSSLGNPEGKSSTVTFTVDTLPPTVTLNPVPTPSNTAKPSFSGTASDRKEHVTIALYPGATTKGMAIATLNAQVGPEGNWTSAPVSPPLANGEYTAIARQQSSLGNGEGQSSPISFTVDPHPPAVAAGPTSLITRSSAALNASVDPNGGTLTACSFQYGTTSSYGTNADCAFSSGARECAFAFDAGAECAFPASSSAVPVLARLFGLQPATTYLYRIVAADEGGIGEAYGTFTTVGARGHNNNAAPDSGYTVTSIHANSNGTITIVLVPIQSGKATLAVSAPTASISKKAIAPKRRKAKNCKKNQIRIKGRCEPATTISGKVSATGVAGARLSLTVKPSSRVKSVLRKGKTVRLMATVTYESSLGGSPTVKVFHQKIKGLRPRKRGRHRRSPQLPRRSSSAGAA